VSRTALIGLLAVVTLGACKEAPTPPAVVEGASPVDSADQFLVGMSTVVHDRGVKRADIQADSAYLFDNSSTIKMRGVAGSFYTSTGVKEAIMSARRGMYDTRLDTLQAFGDVTVISTDGRSIKTPYLRYNKVLNEISSDSAFTITTSEKTMSGIGFKSDPGLNSIEIKRNLSGSMGKVNVPDR
jgi:LPS export ABC transporter protein LptC